MDTPILVNVFLVIFHPSFPICCWTHDRPSSWASDSMFSPHLEKWGSPEKSVDVSMEISITIRDICMNICVLNIWCNQFYGCIFLGIFMGLPWLYQGFTLPLSTRIWPTPRWLHPRGIPIAGGFMENPGNQWMRTGGIPISGTPQIIIRFNTEKIAGNQGPSQKYRFLWTSWGKSRQFQWCLSSADVPAT